MGEIADMHLDGMLCECCGALMEDMTKGAIKQKDGRYKMIKKPPGYPRRCEDCREEDEPMSEIEEGLEDS